MAATATTTPQPVPIDAQIVGAEWTLVGAFAPAGLIRAEYTSASHSHGAFTGVIGSGT